jgi:hypothetical protein
MTVTLVNLFHSQVLLLVWRTLLEGAIFLVPGIAVAWLIESLYRLDVVRFVSLVFIASATAGYVGFWAYLLGPTIGKTLCLCILMASLATVTYAALTRQIKRDILRGVIACATMMAAVTIFYSALGFTYKRSDDPGTQAQLRFVHPLPPDNILPYILAEDLYNSKPFRPFVFIDWKSSDRPPLQSAIVLLQRPLWRNAESELDYLVLAVFLQSMWIAAVWILLQRLSLDRRVAVSVYAFCVFSPFFLLHTFFTWPKLLAASFFTIALSELRFPEGRTSQCDAFDGALGGCAIGLAWLSHGGIAFSIIALAIVLLAKGNRPPIRSAIFGMAALLLMALPWSAYQKLYDPPGDRLLKWHLAGVIQRDPRSFQQALIDAYTTPGISQIIQNKLTNVRTLFGAAPWNDIRQARQSGASVSKRLLIWYKTGTFFFLFQTLGMLNIGFLSFLPGRISAKLKRAPVYGALRRLLLLSGVGIVVWCLLMYIGGSTVVHAGSYAIPLLLYVLLGVSLSIAFFRVTCLLLALQMLVLFPLFALTDLFKKSPKPVPNIGMAWLAAVSFLLLVLLPFLPRRKPSGRLSLLPEPHVLPTPESGSE